jgi:hypothetical protein
LLATNSRGALLVRRKQLAADRKDPAKHGDPDGVLKWAKRRQRVFGADQDVAPVRCAVGSPVDPGTIKLRGEAAYACAKSLRLTSHPRAFAS